MEGLPMWKIPCPGGEMREVLNAGRLDKKEVLPNNKGVIQ